MSLLISLLPNLPKTTRIFSSFKKPFHTTSHGALTPSQLPNDLYHSVQPLSGVYFISSRQSYGNQLEDNKGRLPRVDVPCPVVCEGLRLLAISAFSAS